MNTIQYTCRSLTVILTFKKIRKKKLQCVVLYTAIFRFRALKNNAHLQILLQMTEPGVGNRQELIVNGHI